MNKSLTPGFSAEERATSPYAAFYRPEIAPLSEAAKTALALGAQAPEKFAGLEDAPALIEKRDLPVHTGYARCPDGEVRVFERTEMPGVAPAMWDWWFGWHGSEAQRYKLWHPKAHVDVAWADGGGDTGVYVGRTSHITEYLGPQKVKGAVRFVAPAELGVDETGLEQRGEVCICGRIGPQFPPIDAGWLVHHVYPVPGGAEMQSYFWLAGRHVAARSGGALATSAVRGLARLTGAARQINPAELLEHCTEEMKHLSLILPELYAAFGGGNAAQREAAQ